MIRVTANFNDAMRVVTQYKRYFVEPTSSTLSRDLKKILVDYRSYDPTIDVDVDGYNGDLILTIYPNGEWELL
jgi:hypothetical protein